MGVGTIGPTESRWQAAIASSSWPLSFRAMPSARASRRECDFPSWRGLSHSRRREVIECDVLRIASHTSGARAARTPLPSPKNRRATDRASRGGQLVISLQGAVREARAPSPAPSHVANVTLDEASSSRSTFASLSEANVTLDPPASSTVTLSTPDAPRWRANGEPNRLPHRNRSATTPATTPAPAPPSPPPSERLHAASGLFSHQRD